MQPPGPGMRRDQHSSAGVALAGLQTGGLSARRGRGPVEHHCAWEGESVTRGGHSAAHLHAVDHIFLAGSVHRPFSCVRLYSYEYDSGAVSGVILAK